MSVTGLARSGESPTFYNFSLGVQRSVGLGTVVDVAYVGTLARHLWMSQNLNTLPYGTRFAAQNLDSTTGKVLPDTFLAPYVGHTSVGVRQTGGSSNFHSLQAQAHRRFSRGFELDAIYVWSKSMDYGSAFPMYLSRSLYYGKSIIDRTHNLKLVGVWELPKLSRLWNNPVAWALGDGWQLSTFASFISGAPSGVGFSLSDGADLTGGGDGQRIVLLKNPILPADQRSFYRWFDTTAFARPAKGSIGTAPPDVFRGPGVNSWDVGIKRVFKIKEKAQLEFRLDSYNFFNHTQFSSVNSTARFDASGSQINQQFGQATAARAPRRMQGSLRFRF
jgi:hypothetical protein